MNRTSPNPDDSLAHAIAEEVCIAEHDSRWAAQFAAERSRLLDLLPDRFAAIEHIGSTAVPGLAAKPVIDILAGVNSMGEADALMEPLCAHGYETSAEFNATLPDRRWLMRHAGGRRTHHLHLAVLGGDAWVQRLQFRDMLRADAAMATRYAHLKRDLAEQFRHDREAYTHAKTAFIEEVLTNPKNLNGLMDAAATTPARGGSLSRVLSLRSSAAKRHKGRKTLTKQWSAL